MSPGSWPIPAASLVRSPTLNPYGSLIKSAPLFPPPWGPLVPMVWPGLPLFCLISLPIALLSDLSVSRVHRSAVTGIIALNAAGSRRRRGEKKRGEEKRGLHISTRDTRKWLSVLSCLCCVLVLTVWFTWWQQDYTECVPQMSLSEASERKVRQCKQEVGSTIQDQGDILPFLNWGSANWLGGLKALSTWRRPETSQ